MTDTSVCDFKLIKQHCVDFKDFSNPEGASNDCLTYAFKTIIGKKKKKTVLVPYNLRLCFMNDMKNSANKFE